MDKAGRGCSIVLSAIQARLFTPPVSHICSPLLTEPGLDPRPLPRQETINYALTGIGLLNRELYFEEVTDE